MRILPLLLLFLTSCTQPVLKGDNLPVDGSAWIAPGQLQSSPSGLVLRQRLILIGDAGLYLEDDPTLAALGRWADAGTPATVLFLGDNIYDDGLIEAERKEAEAILSQQLRATRTRKVFIPGNHDWGMDPAKQNLQAILNQQGFIDDWPDGNARWLPRDGCLGPASLVLGDGEPSNPALVLILLDPTPFLTPRLRTACEGSQSTEVHFAALSALLEQHREDHVVVASHYPMLTGGPHGGLSYGAAADVVVGIFGWLYGSLGNTYEPAYAQWIENMKRAMRENPPLVYAAGHDHSLQVLEGEGIARVQVVSGAGAPERVSRVTHIRQTLFAHAAPGFMVLDIGSRNGAEVVRLRVVENGFSAPVFEMDLVPVE